MKKMRPIYAKVASFSAHVADPYSWTLSLECGHDKRITYQSKRKPKVGTIAFCDQCNYPDLPHPQPTA